MPRHIAPWALAVAVLSSAPLAACDPAPRAKTIPVQPVVVRDVPALLRGIIASEVELKNTDPVLVSGFGLVVGLNGTGGGQLPENVASTMEREMGLQGIGKSNLGDHALAGKTPRQILRDPNVAVVIVQAAIPPGLPANSRFDVYLKALNATSLEGGTLWTTDLRYGPPSTFGGAQQRTAAKAKGPLFINPFADTGKEHDGPTREVGRVLDGGWVTEPQPILLSLDNSSWARARGMVSAINSRFPEGAGDPAATARGRSASIVELRIPRRFRQSPAEFLAVVKHLPIESDLPEVYARKWVEGLKAEPALAEDLSWCLESLGPKALPFLGELYDYAEIVPRIAALKAGARLNDARAADGLQAIATSGSGGIRLKAIEYLAEIKGGPRIDMALRGLLEQPELTVRVAAYEALVKRAERDAAERFRQAQDDTPDAQHLSPTAIEILARAQLPRRNIQGIDRRVVDGKFLLDVVPFGEPMIYVTQQHQPRIVIFGADARLTRPMLTSAWGDRLLIKAEATGPIDIRYTPPGSTGAYRGTVEGDLPALITYLAHRRTPEHDEPGLDLNYSDVVGALAALTSSGGTRAALATEQNKLKAQILAAAGSRDQVERPERPGDEPILLNQQTSVVDQPAATHDEKPKIVPIDSPPKK